MELGFDPLVILRLKTIQKIAVGLGILIIISAGYWYFLLNDRLVALETLQATVQQQEKDIAFKRRMLTRLPQLRDELAKLKIEEEKAAQKLPSQKEIPTLLTDISNAGHVQGLEFLLFAPEAEIPRDLYAEVPVGIEVRGSFHATVLFMDQVAKLFRIVTFANMSLEPVEKEPGILVTKSRATTYRFLEADAIQTQDNIGKK